MNDQAPGLSEILRHFSWDLPWLVVLMGAAALYLVAAHRVNILQPRRPQPLWKTCCSLLGLVLIGLAVLSPLEHYGNQVLLVNFAGFLVITMIAPPLILLGSPVTLAFRAMRVPGRRRLRAALRSRPMRILAFPVFAWLAFAVATYLWQFTSLTDIAARNVFVRDLQQASLLVVGLCFWYPALCADPVPWRMAHPLRALYVFVEMTHKGLFGGMFLSMSTPFHSRFAANLPAWAPGPMTDQRIAILILWIGGNMIFVVALVAILVRWASYEGRLASRTDLRLRRAREDSIRRRAALDQVFGKPV